MTATAAQVREYNLHKEACQGVGQSQSTLEHRGLLGSLSVASSTGVKTYTGPDPRTTPPTTTDTLVWATWQPLRLRTSGEPETGRQGSPRLIGQMPAIDDAGNLITLAHDDDLDPGTGQHFKILDPSISPDIGFYTFGLIQRR